MAGISCRRHAECAVLYKPRNCNGLLARPTRPGISELPNRSCALNCATPVPAKFVPEISRCVNSGNFSTISANVCRHMENVKRQKKSIFAISDGTVTYAEHRDTHRIWCFVRAIADIHVGR